jgi:hypothetical protein
LDYLLLYTNNIRAISEMSRLTPSTSTAAGREAWERNTNDMVSIWRKIREGDWPDMKDTLMTVARSVNEEEGKAWGGLKPGSSKWGNASNLPEYDTFFLAYIRASSKSVDCPIHLHDIREEVREVLNETKHGMNKIWKMTPEEEADKERLEWTKWDGRMRAVLQDLSANINTWPYLMLVELEQGQSSSVDQDIIEGVASLEDERDDVLRRLKRYIDRPYIEDPDDLQVRLRDYLFGVAMLEWKKRGMNKVECNRHMTTMVNLLAELDPHLYWQNYKERQARGGQKETGK